MSRLDVRASMEALADAAERIALQRDEATRALAELRAELAAKDARIAELEQVASGNEERVELLVRKFAPGPGLTAAEEARLAALNSLLVLAFPRVPPSASCSLRIAELEAALVDVTPWAMTPLSEAHRSDCTCPRCAAIVQARRALGLDGKA